MRLRFGADLHPATQAEAEAFQDAIGLPHRDDAPRGFAPAAALWVRDRDLLIGQGVALECTDRALAARLRPEGASPALRVGRIDRFGVRPEYREAGVEERLMRALVRRFAGAGPRRSDALLFVGEMMAPVYASTVEGMGARLAEESLR